MRNVVFPHYGPAESRCSMKIGDMLREMTDTNTPSSRRDEIVRLLNEEGDRGERYKGWLTAANTEPYFRFANIDTPHWAGSPLHLCVTQRLTNTSVPTSANFYITFDNIRNFGDAFSVDPDNQKVYWNKMAAKGIGIDGYVIWTAHAVGYRAVYVEGFDANGVSIGTAPLHTFPGNSLVDNVCPVSFKYYFNNFHYIKFFVFQSSGANLVMKEFNLGVTVA